MYTSTVTYTASSIEHTITLSKPLNLSLIHIESIWKGKIKFGKSNFRKHVGTRFFCEKTYNPPNFFFFFLKNVTLIFDHDLGRLMGECNTILSAYTKYRHLG